MIIAWAYSLLESSPIHCIEMSYLHDQLLGGSSVGIMSHSRNDDE